MSANGQLTTAELSPITGGVAGADPGQGQLEDRAAAAWNAMAVEWHERTGTWIRTNGPDSAYRPYGRQVYYWNLYLNGGNLAARPGTSNHGWGTATDDDPNTVNCIKTIGAKYGWRKIEAMSEWWHYNYVGGYTGPDPGPYGGNGQGPITYPTLRKGDEGPAVKRLQKHLRRWNLGLTRPKVDGGFGEATADAVREFQIVHGLEVDGIVGGGTWKALRRKDHFLDDERSQINRLKFRRYDGISDAERPKVERARDWCEKRADSIKKVASEHGWKGQHRRERYKTLHKLGKD